MWAAAAMTMIVRHKGQKRKDVGGGMDDKEASQRLWNSMIRNLEHLGA